LASAAPAAALVACAALGLLISPFAGAFEVEIQESSYHARGLEPENTDSIGLLTPGTIIEIPDKYKCAPDASAEACAAKHYVDPEMAVERWLQEAQETSSLDGKKLPEKYQCGDLPCMMFPVVVAKKGAGSTLPDEQVGKPLLIALQHMLQNGHSFVLAENAEVHLPPAAPPASEAKVAASAPPTARASARAPGPQPAPPAPQYRASSPAMAATRYYSPSTALDPSSIYPAASWAPSARGATTAANWAPTSSRANGAAGWAPTAGSRNAPGASSDLQAQASCVDCRRPTTGMPSGLYEQVSALNNQMRAFSRLALPATGAAPSVDYKNRITGDLQRNFEQTCRLSFAAFQQTLAQTAAKAEVPADILMGLMNKESVGKCDARGSSGELGPFQIMPSSSSFAFCHAKAPAYNAGECARALQNPVVALGEAIRILQYNRATLMSPTLFDGGGSSGRARAQVRGFNPQLMTLRDQYRVAVLAYNQGLGGTIHVLAKMEAYDAAHGTSLSPERWNEFRPFILTSFLEERDKKTLEADLRHLYYAEGVVPYPSS
jgi:hypothetical protein